MGPEGNDYSGDEEEDSYFEGDSYFSYCDKIMEEWGPWDISQYPGFFIKNNKVHYKETIKSKVQNSTKEELTIKIYTLNHIPYQTIICEGTKFYINNFFQGSIINLDVVYLNAASMDLVWPPVFHYLLWTTCSSSMKNMLENQNYRKNYEKEILKTFKSEFQTLKQLETWFNIKLEKTERSVFEERLLNVFLFSGISEKKSKTLVNNFSLTESLDEIIYFYQQLLSRF